MRFRGPRLSLGFGGFNLSGPRVLFGGGSHRASGDGLMGTLIGLCVRLAVFGLWLGVLCFAFCALLVVWAIQYPFVIPARAAWRKAHGVTPLIQPGEWRPWGIR